MRRGIVSLLKEEEQGAREISQRLGIPEREVFDHLEHVRAGLGDHLVVIASRCLGCGFTFRKRERLKSPGRCPVCRGERISEPRFSVRQG